MTTSYASHVSGYTFHQVANDGAGTFFMQLPEPAPTDVEGFDAAIEAFADALSSVYHIDSVTKVISASASDDWSYIPS